MESRHYASKFKVSSLTKELQLEANLRLELQRLGFQTTAYSAKALDAHILIIDTVALEDSLSQVVEQALAQNPDLRIILLCKASQMRVLLEYKKYQADALIDTDDPFLKEKILWAVERSARSLYLFYQNEQLLKDYSDVQKQLDKSLQLASTLPLTSRGIDSGRGSKEKKQDSQVYEAQRPISLLSKLFRCESLDSTLEFFNENAPHEKKIFLRFDGSTNRFQAVYSEGLQLGEMSSVSYSINSVETRELLGSKFMQLPEGLEDFLVRIFQDPHFLIFPMIFNNSIFGFSVMNTSKEELDFQREREYLDVIGRAALSQMELFWSRLQLRHFEIKDEKTSLYNESYYCSMLENEVTQVVQNRQPLSLLVFEIDNFEGLKTLLGEALFSEKFILWCNELPRYLSDRGQVFRLGEKTFAFILPQCTPKEAVHAAERLMKFLSAHSELRETFQTVLSFGVSSFPQLCSSARELDTTARRVLRKVQERGGNRVGVYRRPAASEAPLRAEAD